MKGPGHRHKFDVRRIWECPACRKQVRTSGQVAHLACACQANSGGPAQTWMSLLEEKPRPWTLLPKIE